MVTLGLVQDFPLGQVNSDQGCLGLAVVGHFLQLLDRQIGLAQGCQQVGTADLCIKTVFTVLHPAVPLNRLLILAATLVNPAEVILGLTFTLSGLEQFGQILFGVVKTLGFQR